jgi:L-fuconolactonase
MPEQPFVLDHLAKPRIALGTTGPEFASWRRDIEALASHSNVSCKLSGLVTEAAWCRWRREDFTPYLDVALAAFRPDRLMFGSDWPVCLLSGDYAAVVDIVTTFIGTLAEGEREAILGGTAARFYGLA